MALLIVPAPEIKTGLDRTIATLKMSPESFSKRYEVSFFEFEEEGLGIGKGLVVKTECGFQFGLRSFVNGRPNYLEVVVNINSDSLWRDLREILSVLKLDEQDLEWISEDVGRPGTPDV